MEERIEGPEKTCEEKLAKLHALDAYTHDQMADLKPFVAGRLSALICLVSPGQEADDETRVSRRCSTITMGRKGDSEG